MKNAFSSFTVPVLLAACASLAIAAHAIDPPATDPGTPPVVAPAPVSPPAPAKPAMREMPRLLENGVASPEITAVDLAGLPVKLSDFKGKVVVVDFWASWCPPCKASMPHNQEVIKKLQDAKVPVVLLAVDNSEHGIDSATRHEHFATWVKAHREYDALKFVFVDPGEKKIAGPDFHVSGIPTQYVIDAQGVIRASSVGYGGPTDDLENSVRAAAQPATPSVAAK